MTTPNPTTAEERQFLQYLNEASLQIGRAKEIANSVVGKIASVKTALDGGEDVTTIVDELVELSRVLTAQIIATEGSVSSPPIIIGLTASVIPANDLATSEPIPYPLPEPPTPPTQ